MRQLTKFQSCVFLAGGLLIVLGAGLSLLQGLGGGLYVVCPYVFAVGAICFASMQLLQRYEGTDFTIRRLRRIMVISDLLFLFAALLMFASQDNPLKLDQITYVQYVYQKWVVVLLIAAILQLYSFHRISTELEKEAKKR